MDNPPEIFLASQREMTSIVIPMSEFANALRTLRGAASQRDVARAAKLEVRTIWRAENGQPVQLNTLRALAGHFRLSRSAYAELLVAWLRDQLGNDFAMLDIRSAVRPGAGRPKSLSEAEKLADLIRAVPAKYQRELARACQRKEVLASIAPLNEMYDNLQTAATKVLAANGQS